MISVQLYTVRDAVAADSDAALARLAELGFRDVELFGFPSRAEELARGLRRAGLTASSTHASLVDAADPDVDRVFAEAARLGIRTVIEPAVRAERWTDSGAIRATADRLNALAVRAREHGVTIGYHNHYWELEPEIDGVSALEAFAGMLDDTVILEVDTYWAATGGADPAGLLRRLGDRVTHLHVKDGPATREPEAQVALGAGSIDIPAVLAAAPQAVRVVELDGFRGDIFDALADSLAYLRERGEA